MSPQEFSGRNIDPYTRYGIIIIIIIIVIIINFLWLGWKCQEIAGSKFDLRPSGIGDKLRDELSRSVMIQYQVL